MLAAWPVSKQLCWAGNESITHAWPFYRKGQGHFSLNWLDSLMSFMCFPCSLSLSALCVGNWARFLPLHLALLLFPLHCLQGNVMYLKKSSNIDYHDLFLLYVTHLPPPVASGLTGISSLLFHLSTSHPSFLPSHCNRSHLILRVPFGPSLLNIQFSGTKSHFSCSVVTAFNIFELLLPLILLI